MTKEEMIAKMDDMLQRFYYEDVEFFYNMVNQFAEKKRYN